MSDRDDDGRDDQDPGRDDERSGADDQDPGREGADADDTQPGDAEDPLSGELADELAGIFEGIDPDELDLSDASGQLPPGIADALGKLGDLGTDGPDSGLPPQIAGMFEQLGLGGEGGQLPPQIAGMFEQLGLSGGDLPPELSEMFEQLSTPEGRADLERQAQAMFGEGGPLGALFGGGGSPLAGMFGGAAPGGTDPVSFGFTTGDAQAGPVDWALASRVAEQVAADGDREPTAEETTRLTEAVRLAEHWLDDSALPAPPDAGRVRIASRAAWIVDAIAAMRPVVDPVARASTGAMVDLAREQFSQLDPDALGLPEELGPLRDAIGQLSGDDLADMLRPVGAMMAGLQAGQVLGQLARDLLGQFDLALPTGPRSQAQLVAVNVDDAFGAWDLDPTEVALVLALHEAAMRRLFHAVPWLEAHVHSLIARFASGTVVDASRLEELTRGLVEQVDPDDPASLEAAMARAAELRLEPTADQERVLERLQGVVSLVGAWARQEVARVAAARVPSLSRITEVQRRRRAERGDGDDLLAVLLGLDLRPDDETIGERFVTAVEAARGPQGLRRTLEHPENLPDAAELADPVRWLARTEDDGDVPDDPAALFGDLDDAPTEASADERLQDGGDEPTAEGDTD